ncbi:hypothetical protein D3C87_1397920 [compost metagenome]
MGSAGKPHNFRNLPQIFLIRNAVRLLGFRRIRNFRKGVDPELLAVAAQQVVILQQNGQHLVAHLGLTNRSRPRLPHIIDVELLPLCRALRVAQPAHQFSCALQLRINRACIDVARPLGEGVARQHASAAHAVGIDMLNTLKTAEHGSQAQRLLGAAGGELLQVSEHSEQPALAFDLVAEIHPYLFSLFIRRQNGRMDLAGFWVDMLRAGGDLFKPRPVRLQTRVCVGVALQ